MTMGRIIGQGRTADVYEFADGNVLKWYHESMPRAAVVEEYRVSQAVSATGVLTPKPLEMIEVEGRIGIVFQKVEGDTLLKQLASHPWRIGTLTRQLAELHVSIHQQKAPDALRQQKVVLRDSISHAPYLTDDEKEQVLLELDALPAGDSLCHGDFHPDNVLVGRETWIIDWMTGMSGSPAVDTARTVLLLRLGTLPEGMPAWTRAAIQVLRKVMLYIYLKQYLLRSRMK
ncbi:phosphotransferase family protein [Paenibacillus agilis]|uniref:Phosphotransferase n=1 Tax=Paenibacillus agilis TaxID=3020863 RepID=A0A559J3D2_9BACL|nr:aminoglycoside phosphotransferase family protein [Paenibacillus agilis]TVX94400.1 phosphotransferase [Paenibacillus agilis]